MLKRYGGLLSYVRDRIIMDARSHLIMSVVISSGANVS